MMSEMKMRALSERNTEETHLSTRYVEYRMPSPVGELTLLGGDQGLAAVLWEGDRPGRVRLRGTSTDVGHPVLVEAQRQLGEYFAGNHSAFSIALDLQGTAFQKRVWEALLTIPFGETRSYGQLALHIGKPSATRAVGAAIGRNPLSIIVPCHRVIGASGSLTGFAGGLKTKARLLELEAARSDAGALRFT